MFPIPFNFPFRKSNGDISTIGAEISAGGGGSSYILPTASANTKGGIKVGDGLTMDGEVLKNTNPTLPTASADTLGGVKVGSGLSINENGVLSASGGGGGGGVSCHLFRVKSDSTLLTSGFVLTSVDATITDKASFITALQHGVCFVTSGYQTASGSSNKYPITQFYVPLNTDSLYYQYMIGGAYDYNAVSSGTSITFNTCEKYF